MAVKEWNAKDYPGIQVDISVDGDKFFKATDDCLKKLVTKDVGRELLETLSKRCQGIGRAPKDGKVVIILAPGTIVDFANIWDDVQADKVFAGTKAKPVVWDDSKRVIKTVAGVELKFPGKGSDAIAAYTPGPLAERTYEDQAGVKTPSFIALAHELIHCLHILSGDVPKGAKWNANEEARTVGAGKYKENRMSENAIRKEHGIALRAYYDEEGDCDAAKL